MWRTQALHAAASSHAKKKSRVRVCTTKASVLPRATPGGQTMQVAPVSRIVSVAAGTTTPSEALPAGHELRSSSNVHKVGSCVRRSANRTSQRLRHRPKCLLSFSTQPSSSTVESARRLASGTSGTIIDPLLLASAPCEVLGQGSAGRARRGRSRRRPGNNNNNHNNHNNNNNSSNTNSNNNNNNSNSNSISISNSNNNNLL